jgi:hypothetical protein
MDRRSRQSLWGSRQQQKRVFVAMPFDASHSDKLWVVIEAACKIHGLHATRADHFVHSRPILTDIRDEIEKAEFIIADVTDLNPNVMYELGLAHAETESVVILCRKGQTLPFDIAGMRCIFYDLLTPSWHESLLPELLRALKSPPEVPTVIRGKIDRTRWIIKDLEALAAYPNEALDLIGFTGFETQRIRKTPIISHISSAPRDANPHSKDHTSADGA